jgi:hypothetical protein
MPQPETYPRKELVADVLAVVARRAVMASNAEHPEDLGIAAMNAVENAALTLAVLNERGLL